MMRKILSSKYSPRIFIISKCHSSAASNGPLKGVKVLDLTRIIAGPLCTLMLADYGADIYKVENPSRGDDCRQWPPIFQDSQTSSSFIALNRNKKSICVDFKTKSGQDLLQKMAEKCDVLVENYVPGVLKKYSLDYETLSKRAPHLIYCSVTGFGSEGPYSHKPGVDLIAASLSGNLHITGPEDGEPCRAGTSSIDIMTGLRANSAIIAALYERQRTGRGRKIDADLFSTAVSALKNYAISYLNLNLQVKRLGSEHNYVVPYKCFKSKDSYITLGAINDAQFKTLCEVIGKSELADDERFVTAAKRSANRKSLVDILIPIFQQRTTEEWCKSLAKTTLLHAPVNDISQVFEDPHVKAIKLVKEIDHPTCGKLKVLDSPVKFSDYSSEMKPPPLLGQHTAEVLHDLLNLTEEEIVELKSKKVAPVTPPTLRLKCRKPKSDKSVKWNEGTVDNENMNKKKSKCCCIYKKPKQRFDESSDSESDECENCFGHVEVKKAKKLAKASCAEQSASTSSSDVNLEHPQPINPSGMTTVSS